MTDKLTKEQREDLIGSLKYFWEEKGDLTRLREFNDGTVAREFPNIVKAWENFKFHEKILDLIIKDTYEKHSNS